MRKGVTFKNRDRFTDLGITIGYIRRLRGLSQEQLAERAGISRTHLSVIEAPNMMAAFSMDVYFNIADALEIDPGELLSMKIPGKKDES